MPPVWRYTVTGEVFVTYEETRTGGNLKYVQDASAGIRILDRNNGLKSSYGEGKGLKNLRGLLETGTDLTFVPVSGYAPTESSSGNVINPIMLTYDEFYTQCYTGSHAYESMLVKITTPMIANDDYDGSITDQDVWVFDNLDLATWNAKGNFDYFIQKVFNANYIGDNIPMVPTVYQGIRTNVMWGTTIYGLMTPRKKTDIMAVTAPVILAVPNPAAINGVLPGQCKYVDIKIYNEGAGTLNITAVYLDDLPATDEFNIVAPPAVPFAINSWNYKTIRVEFCPLNSGTETTNLIVEYGVGKVLVVPINGTTPLIFDMPYLQEFKQSSNPTLWETGDTFNRYTDITGWEHKTAATAVGGVYVAYYSNWVTPYGGFVGNNKSIYMRPRGGGAGAKYNKPVTVTTPGFNVTGTDPVVSWVEHAWYALEGNPLHNFPSPDPRILSISEDGVNWTELRNVPASSMSWSGVSTTGDHGYTTPTYDMVNVSLKDYIGKTVYFKLDLKVDSGVYCYWIIDNFAVKERVTAPIFAASPGSVSFGGVQVGQTATQTVTITNTGISVLKIKKVELIGAIPGGAGVTSSPFSLSDSNTYPVEVTAAGGDWAYSMMGASQLNFNVSFSPTDVGMQTAKVRITYGLYSDMVAEVPLMGEGLSCLTAAEAHIGENLAPIGNTWYKYTAEKFQITQITSCDPRNVTVPFSYSYDTYLRIFRDCDNTTWSGAAYPGTQDVDWNDDMEGNCPTNRANSSLELVMNEGETVYIFWDGIFLNDCETCALPFYFHIIPNYPIDGDVCETAIPLTLPVVNHFGTTVGFNDDYDASPCSPFSNYMDGNDKVYSITLAEEGYLLGDILGAYGSIHVLDKCPKVELEKNNCKAYIGGPNGGSFRKKVPAGFYYVIISTWAPPQTVDFLLNMSWESGSGVEDGDLLSTLSVYPNPTSGRFTVSISNAEATDMTIEFVNISGQVVYRNEVKATYSYTDEIDASQFAKGVYYLKVNNGKEVKVEKVVVN
jgi:hypothetical protein